MVNIRNDKDRQAFAAMKDIETLVVRAREWYWKLQECQDEIMKLPQPPSQHGDGPQERVENALKIIERERAMRELYEKEIEKVQEFLEEIDRVKGMDLTETYVDQLIAYVKRSSPNLNVTINVNEIPKIRRTLLACGTYMFNHEVVNPTKDWETLAEAAGVTPEKYRERWIARRIGAIWRGEIP